MCVTFLAVASGTISADAGDEVCFPLYRKARAIPLTSSCQLNASTANVNLGTYYCTSQLVRIERFCGTLPKGNRCERDANPSTGNPIEISSGNKWLQESDYAQLSVPGLLTRHYNSSPSYEPGKVIGAAWRFGFEASLTITPAYIAANRPDGRIHYFRGGGSVFSPDVDVRDRVSKLSAGSTPGWLYRDDSAGRLEYYDESGRLHAVHTMDGKSLQLIYSTADTPLDIAPGPGFLIALREPNGRELGLIYASNRLARLSLPDDSQVSYGYQAGNLSEVAHAGLVSSKYLYNEAAHTGNANLPDALTGIVNSDGKRSAVYSYSNKGLAVSEHRLATEGEPVGAYRITRESTAGPAQAQGISVVVDPMEVERRYGFKFIRGLARRTSLSQPAGSGCEAASSQLAYDGNGNISQRDDFNGVRSCHGYDMARGLEISRVEGLSTGANCSALLAAGAALPPASRKVSQQYHPDWNLSTRLAEPGRFRTRVYNGQPDPLDGGRTVSCAPADALLPDGKPITVLCREHQQATTDVDGAKGFDATLLVGTPTRSRHYSYDAAGRLLTDMEPSGSKVVYSYHETSGDDHRTGDLKSASNALGHTAHFKRYNAHGQVLDMEGPDGVLTLYTYDSRQRLSSISKAGSTTRFDYGSNGQIKQITRPDNSFITYEYDGADRLTAIADGHGNRIEYALDKAGNRIAERVKDLRGELVRELEFQRDALGRIEQTRGRE
jgi:YD repeat-containing protein